MDSELISLWRQDIVGDWLEELTGLDLLYLERVTDRAPCAFTLHSDGRYWDSPGTFGEHAVPSRPEAPFPATWELSNDGILSFIVPIPPMPDIGMPEWSRDSIQYDVLSITHLSLVLSDRRFDGEFVTVWRRVNTSEYEKRKANEYLEQLDVLKEIVENSKSTGRTPNITS